MVYDRVVASLRQSVRFPIEAAQEWGGRGQIHGVQGTADAM